MADVTPLPFSLAGAPPQQWIAAPSPVYLTGEEFLRLSSLCNLAAVTLTVSGRVLRPDNTVERVTFTHAPNSTRTIASTDTALPEGWLLGVTVRASAGTPAWGQVWVNLELGVGLTGSKTILQTLGSGFAVTNVPWHMPGGVNYQPLDGPGNLRSITGTTPAAGAEISEAVPTGARWELMAFRYLFTTSATVANRVSEFSFDDGTTVYHLSYGNQTQAATTNQTYNNAPGMPIMALGNGSNSQRPLPSGLRLGAGHRIKTATIGLQAGDQYSAVQYLVREWMTGE